MWTILSILSVLCVAQCYQDANGKWMECPQGYSAINGMCYSTSRCQEGYRLHTDGMCHLINPAPCPYDTKPIITTPSPYYQMPTTSTSTSTTTTTPAPEEEPIISYDPVPIGDPDEQARCPPGSIYFRDECRKILCTRGEYYDGRCLSPACPMGTVWWRKQCQKPGYITTVLEIDNVINNKHEFRTATENVNKVEYKTIKPYDPSTDQSHAYVESKVNSVVKTTTPDSLTQQLSASCCTVNSPRICRKYGVKWVCFNQKRKLCDPKVCTSPVIYLKPPEIVELDNPRMLVMPPNPPISSCMTPDCLESAILNCSGCAQGLRESCSTGCYYYFCPSNRCEFKESEDFCAIYPGEFGCNKNYGCIWKWCK
ncbi:uncharacterized protein LOC6572229 [Drosophila mojavensis]|uniref:Chitin-binding type-2 domain-containing protein n=1 Tax=Drosophila mojavensis TaxID=7230 RepID=B4KDJ8_DROMO|nr:uncharacterized protein LOC6572229 [Drosophila mojavensis]EDW13832.2 uncharacterized protein Dmoj_GI23665 [Drosophila mojavensis]